MIKWKLYHAQDIYLQKYVLYNVCIVRGNKSYWFEWLSQADKNSVIVSKVVNIHSCSPHSFCKDVFTMSTTINSYLS